MSLRSGAVIAAFTSTLSSMSAHAYEFGFGGFEQKPGIVLGNAATAPPPGLYMFEQSFISQGNLVGPGAPNTGGRATPVHVFFGDAGLLWVPGWTFLGGTYNAVVVQPYMMGDVGAPLNLQPAGLHNTQIIPGELSWRLGDSGFFVKTGLGIFTPDGTKSGINGLGGFGNPWWTFKPEFVISYLKDGWNLTANIFTEINTKNSITGYRSGDVLHAEFTATKKIGKWTVGPVAYYAGQVTNDQSSAFYGGAINVNRYDLWAAGALVGYDFGTAALNVWALDEVSARASGGTAGPPGLDTAAVTKGWTVFASLSYRLWAPEPLPTPQRPPFFK